MDIVDFGNGDLGLSGICGEDDLIPWNLPPLTEAPYFCLPKSEVERLKAIDNRLKKLEEDNARILREFLRIDMLLAYLDQRILNPKIDTEDTVNIKI